MDTGMDRVNRILFNDKYCRLMAVIKDKERDRIFCRHGLDHCFDVARIAYIMCLEEDMGIEKEYIYAAALLHDIGRADPEESGVQHHLLSVELAGEILRECGFDERDTDMICDAIGSHNTDGDTRKGLSYILYRADKQSRNCFDCTASDECYWPDAERNLKIRY